MKRFFVLCMLTLASSGIMVGNEPIDTIGINKVVFKYQLYKPLVAYPTSSAWRYDFDYYFEELNNPDCITKIYDSKSGISQICSILNSAKPAKIDKFEFLPKYVEPGSAYRLFPDGGKYFIDPVNPDAKVEVYYDDNRLVIAWIGLSYMDIGENRYSTPAEITNMRLLRKDRGTPDFENPDIIKIKAIDKKRIPKKNYCYVVAKKTESHIYDYSKMVCDTGLVASVSKDYFDFYFDLYRNCDFVEEFDFTSLDEIRKVEAILEQYPMDKSTGYPGKDTDEKPQVAFKVETISDGEKLRCWGSEEVWEKVRRLLMQIRDSNPR